MKALCLFSAVFLALAPLTAAEPSVLHPKVFSLIECWLSDSEYPVVTEINLDAVEANKNQFDADAVKRENGWIRCPGEEGHGFLRYRVLEHQEGHLKVEFQSNGGGTLTSASIIECQVEERKIRVDGKVKTVRVLKVLGYALKS